ncbi:MAG: hypothetical protein O3B25_09030 [Verrucomicrobia bacterium]|nr:hypothetical protein [Verrucomicrobiota bacterium]
MVSLLGKNDSKPFSAPRMGSGEEECNDFEKAVMNAIKNRGYLVSGQVGVGGVLGCIVRPKGSPSAVVRELGPRNLDEIPPSELTAVARKVLSEPIKPDEKSFRAILDFYGLTRLTAHGRELLGEILSRLCVLH